MAGAVSSARPRAGHGRIPTYCAAVRGAHHVVVLELEVLVEDGRVELHLAVVLVAHLLPVGGWLRHGYRGIMARGALVERSLSAGASVVMELRS